MDPDQDRPGSKLFDTLIVFLKEFLKSQPRQQKHENLPSMQRVNEALPGVLRKGGGGGRGVGRGIYFRGTGEQRPHFEGNKDNIGEQGTKENKFSIFGEHGNKPIYSPPPPPEPPGPC